MHIEKAQKGKKEIYGFCLQVASTQATQATIGRAEKGSATLSRAVPGPWFAAFVPAAKSKDAHFPTRGPAREAGS